MKKKKPEIDLDQFTGDVFSVISSMGAWNQFKKAMEEYGYSEKEVDDSFTAIGERLGREL